jgi:hypothetical protein
VVTKFNNASSQVYLHFFTYINLFNKQTKHRSLNQIKSKVTASVHGRSREVDKEISINYALETMLRIYFALKRKVFIFCFCCLSDPIIV